jgi:hypothetical protein
MNLADQRHLQAIKIGAYAADVCVTIVLLGFLIAGQLLDSPVLFIALLGTLGTSWWMIRQVRNNLLSRAPSSESARFSADSSAESAMSCCSPSTKATSRARTPRWMRRTGLTDPR